MKVQNSLIKNKICKKRLKLFFAMIAATLAFGCEKQNQNVRAKGGVPKTATPIAADPGATARAQAQNAQTGFDVAFSDVFTPDYTDANSISVDSDVTLKLPQEQSLPLSTKHDYGGSDAFGQITLGNGLILKVLSKCSGQDCHAYHMLVSLEKGGAIVAQAVALSFACDKNYYRDSLPKDKYVHSLSEVETFYSGISATNDNCDAAASASTDETVFNIGGN